MTIPQSDSSLPFEDSFFGTVRDSAGVLARLALSRIRCINQAWRQQ